MDAAAIEHWLDTASVPAASGLAPVKEAPLSLPPKCFVAQMPPPLPPPPARTSVAHVYAAAALIRHCV